MSGLASFAPAITVIAITLGAERLAKAPRTDWLINLQAWGLRIAMLMLFGAWVSVWQGPALINAAALPTWAAILLYFLVYDLGEYVFHIAQHRIPWLWKMHSLHHSDPEMSVLTTNRHFWADTLIKMVTVWSVSAFVISPTPLAVSVYTGLNLWNFIAHSRLSINFGWWSWLINTPAYHRRHHSALPEHYDSNFAALLPIWDVLTGNYRRPDGFPPTGFANRPHNLRELLFWPLYADRDTAAAPGEAMPLRP